MGSPFLRDQLTQTGLKQISAMGVGTQDKTTKHSSVNQVHACLIDLCLCKDHLEGQDFKW